MQYTWQLALVLVPVYFIKHSVSWYISITNLTVIIACRERWDRDSIAIDRGALSDVLPEEVRHEYLD